MNKNKRLDRLELILKRKSAGTNEEYLNAINRETARVRNYIEACIRASEADKPFPKKPPSDEKDLEIIKNYEAIHPRIYEPSVRERFMRKIELIRKRMSEEE